MPKKFSTTERAQHAIQLNIHGAQPAIQRRRARMGLLGRLCYLLLDINNHRIPAKRNKQN
jgi:hypothetical protein